MKIMKINNDELIKLCNTAICNCFIDNPVIIQDMQDECAEMAYGGYYDELWLTSRKLHRRYENPEWINVWKYLEEHGVKKATPENKWRDYISNELRNKKCGDKPAK